MVHVGKYTVRPMDPLMGYAWFHCGSFAAKRHPLYRSHGSYPKHSWSHLTWNYFFGVFGNPPKKTSQHNPWRIFPGRKDIYLPTWMVVFVVVNVGKYTVRPMDASWGICLIMKHVVQLAPTFFCGRLAMGGQATEGRINKFTNSEAWFTARLAYRDEQMSHRWKDDGHHIPNISWALHKWSTVITNTCLNVHLRWPSKKSQQRAVVVRTKPAGCGVSYLTDSFWF